jgi:chemotaxis response regulator CheB
MTVFNIKAVAPTPEHYLAVATSHIALISPSRLQREAIRRSLSLCPANTELGKIMLDCYASDFVDLHAAIAHAPPRLCLFSAALPGVDIAARTLRRRNVSVAVLIEPGREIGQDTLRSPWLDDTGELRGAQQFTLQLERWLARTEGGHQTLAVPATVPQPVNLSGERNATVVPRLLAIGASTGGPTAIRSVLNALPRPLPFAVLIVQHIDADYAQGFSDWLSSECQLPAHLVQGRATPRDGTVHIAPPGLHLALSASGELILQPGNALDAHTPGVETLFQSLSRHSTTGIAILLTGMGSDGAQGLRTLRDRGWQTYAQDAQSAVVHGMPGAAIACGGAQFVLNPAAIGKQISAMHLEPR